jgi:hypothetical protein
LVFDACKVQALARNSLLRRVAQLVAIGAGGGVLAALDTSAAKNLPTGMPASLSLRIATICDSLNYDLLIRDLPRRKILPEKSSFETSTERGSLRHLGISAGRQRSTLAEQPSDDGLASDDEHIP